MKRTIMSGVALLLSIVLLVSCVGEAKEEVYGTTEIEAVERTGVITLEGQPLTLLGPRAQGRATGTRF